MHKHLKILAPLATLLLFTSAYLMLEHYSAQGHRHSLMIAVLTCTFFFAATLYAFRHYVPLNYKMALLLLFGIIWIRHTSLHAVYTSFTLVYCVLVIAYLPKGKILLFNRLGDYSYGVYIYAFPVQQSLAHWFPSITLGEMITWASVITLALSALSWHFIEYPILQRKAKVTQTLRFWHNSPQSKS